MGVKWQHQTKTITTHAAPRSPDKGRTHFNSPPICRDRYKQYRKKGRQLAWLRRRSLVSWHDRISYMSYCLYKVCAKMQLSGKECSSNIYPSSFCRELFLLVLLLLWIRVFIKYYKVDGVMKWKSFIQGVRTGRGDGLFWLMYCTGMVCSSHSYACVA